MRKNKKKIISILLIILSIISIGVNAYAHSGRTDSSGGHKDNNNKSGLGSYHYHCGGHPAHLHTMVFVHIHLVHQQVKVVHQVLQHQVQKQHLRYQLQ